MAKRGRKPKDTRPLVPILCYREEQAPPTLYVYVCIGIGPSGRGLHHVFESFPLAERSWKLSFSNLRGQVECIQSDTNHWVVHHNDVLVGEIWKDEVRTEVEHL